MLVKRARWRSLAVASVPQFAVTYPYGAAIARLCTPQPNHPDSAVKAGKNILLSMEELHDFQCDSQQS
jgi:hypothetical protein